MKKKCLIVINEMSGRSRNVDCGKLVEKYGGAYDVDIKRIAGENDDWSPLGYDLIVACGGDGTFNHTMNNGLPESTDVIYYSCGTFNECAKAKGKSGDNTEFIRIYEYATANGGFFGYVAAAGSFTPLGYVVDSESKKKMGVLAYVLKVLQEYKVYSIPARITADGNVYKGNYTVIMAIDSMRCFGFRFNRLYAPDDGKVHYLLIKSPGKNNLLNKIRIFFPLFRSFFLGFGKETDGKKVVFRSAERISIELDKPEVFDVDGDAKTFGGRVDIAVKVPKNKVYIGNFDTVKK